MALTTDYPSHGCSLMSVVDHQYWLGLQGYSAQAPTIELCQHYFRHHTTSFPGQAPATLFIATIMSKESGCHDCQVVLALNICGLLYDLGQLTYNGIKPKLEYWIEYVLTEQFVTVNDLVERVLPVAWDTRGSHSDISQFLKEFCETPHRSEQARSFIDGLCLHVLRWFAVASVFCPHFLHPAFFPFSLSQAPFYPLSPSFTGGKGSLN